MMWTQINNCIIFWTQFSIWSNCLALLFSLSLLSSFCLHLYLQHSQSSLSFQNRKADLLPNSSTLLIWAFSGHCSFLFLVQYSSLLPLTGSSVGLSPPPMETNLISYQDNCLSCPLNNKGISFLWPLLLHAKSSLSQKQLIRFSKEVLFSKGNNLQCFRNLSL